MAVYSGYMKSSRYLRNRYLFIFDGDINEISECKKIANDRNIWGKCDYLIYNPFFTVGKNAPSHNEIKKWIKPECILISVTNVAFDGYMPQHTNIVFKNDGLFVWGDKNLNRILELRENDEADVIAYGKLLKEDFYSEDEVLRHYQKSIRRLRLIEKDCDIKIADYIETNGMYRVLFYSTTHPEDEVMREITRRILFKMNEIDIFSQNKIKCRKELLLQSHGEIVYPAVYKGLRITGDYRERYINPGSYNDRGYSIDEYMREYLRMGRERKRNE